MQARPGDVTLVLRQLRARHRHAGPYPRVPSARLAASNSRSAGSVSPANIARIGRPPRRAGASRDPRPRARRAAPANPLAHLLLRRQRRRLDARPPRSGGRSDRRRRARPPPGHRRSRLRGAARQQPEPAERDRHAQRRRRRRSRRASAARPAVLALGLQAGEPRELLGPRRCGSASSTSAAKWRRGRSRRRRARRPPRALDAVLADRLEHPVARRGRVGDQEQRPVDERARADRARRRARLRAGADRSRCSGVTPAGKTARRAARPLGLVSRSQLQSTTARSVRCRGSAARLPPVSSRKRSSRRAAIWAPRASAGARRRARSRAAARRAAGRSRRRPRRLLVDPRSRATPRRRGRRTADGRMRSASSAVGVGVGTRAAAAPQCSPAIPRGSRLVASDAQVGTAGEQPSASARPPRRDARSCRARAAASRSASTSSSARARARQAAPRPETSRHASRRPSPPSTAAATSARSSRPRARPSRRRRRVCGQAPATDLDGEARLAGAARADERHEPVVVEQRGQLGDLLLAADEARDAGAQVVRGATPRGHSRAPARITMHDRRSARPAARPTGSRRAPRRVAHAQRS